MVSVSATPRIGDRVLVPWGLDQVEADVVEVYRLGGFVRLRVRVPVLGPDGEELDGFVVGIPLKALSAYSS